MEFSDKNGERIMSTMILCSGTKAKNPFRIWPDLLPVYTIEELCFYIKEQFCFLKKESIRPSLIDWIEGDLHLPGLARQLRIAVAREVSTFRLGFVLLENSGLYSEAELSELEKNVFLLENKTEEERQKLSADILLQKYEYKKALYLYWGLLKESVFSKLPIRIQADIYYKMGLIYARCGLYPEALHMFDSSYHILEINEVLNAYYFTKRRMEERREGVASSSIVLSEAQTEQLEQRYEYAKKESKKKIHRSERKMKQSDLEEMLALYESQVL